MKLYPFQDVCDLAGRSPAEVGRILGLSGATVSKYTTMGMREAVADRVACGLGLHPATVWPDWLEDQIEDVTMKGRAKKAAQMRKRRRSKAVRAADRERARRHYYETLDYSRAVKRRYKREHAAELREKRRVYYEANKDRIRANQRAYYARNRERLLAKQAERDRAKRATSRDEIAA